MDSPTETAPASWTAPLCPFSIEYVPRVLDDIRLAVVDAFFSLPRGGAEIGGILLGTYDKSRLLITDYLALPCEHAFGPSFVLSPTDHAKLAEMLAMERGNPEGRQPVGWYHSHTRTDIFLSDADLDIHQRYFPMAWQVALVLKPHTFQPTRGGFFFREADGTIHGTASYQEFILEPLAVRPIPEEIPPALPQQGPAHAERKHPEPAGPVINVMPQVESTPPAPAPAPALTLPPVEAAPRRAAEVSAPGVQAEVRPQTTPQFLAPAESGSPRWIFVATIVVGLMIGAGIYRTRDVWMPRMAITFGTVIPKTPSPFIGLNAMDTAGQLQIKWDHQSPAVRDARDGILIITEGSTPEAIELDPAHLRAGSFTYGRRGERVDVSLTLNQPDGQKIHEATSYLGKLPESKPADEDASIRAERDALAKEAAKLANDLKAQQARTNKLEKSIQDMRTDFQKGQLRKRLENQSATPVK